jgi:hypothetical protein
MNPLEARRNGYLTEKPWHESKGVRANAAQIARSGPRKRANALKGMPMKKEGTPYL